MKTPISGAQSVEAFHATSYFSVLDGLRAFSILLVLWHHVPRVLQTGWFYTFQENGRYGVSLFFLISGFLICTLLLREEQASGRIDLWKFYGRRALRLLPLYYAALLLQAVLIFALHQHSPDNQALFRAKLPSYLLYYSNWLPTATQGPFFFAWSLAVEEQFYLVFGLLLVFASRRFIVGLAATALLAKALAYACFGNVDVHSTLWRVIFSYQEPILLGVLTAFALHWRQGYEFFARRLGSAWVPACSGVAALAWLWLHPMRSQSAWDAQLLYLLMALTVAGLVIRPATPVLSARPITHVGKISYGIYLLHMFVISTVKKLPEGTSPAFCLFASSLLTIAWASLTYKYFEYPIISFYKQRLSPLQPVAVAGRLRAKPVAIPIRANRARVTRARATKPEATVSEG